VLRQLQWLHSRLPLLSTSLCLAMPQVTWLTTVTSSPTPVSDNCVLLTLKHSLSVGCTAVLETGPLPPQDHKSGTVWHPIPHYVGCHTASSGGYWRHFYSESEATTQSELFVTVLNRNILTYLLIIGIIVILSINSHSKCQQHKCHIST